MICFEWWALEMIILFSGLLGVDQLDSNVILISVSQLKFMVSIGISEALSTLGNFIGVNQV
jgi:Na+-driven multidrug efflux pump